MSSINTIKSKSSSLISCRLQKTTQQKSKSSSTKKKLTNNIIIIEFNSMGIVSKKEFLNIKNMNDIRIAEQKTKKKYDQDDVLYDIFSTLREKLNVTSKRKK